MSEKLIIRLSNTMVLCMSVVRSTHVWWMEPGGLKCERQEVDGTRVWSSSRSASTSRRSVALQDFSLSCLRCFEDFFCLSGDGS